MASTRNLIAFAIAAFALIAALHSSVEANSFPSSPSQTRRLSAAEGPFVRGMMAADQQFELYMAVSETSRGVGGAGEGGIVDSRESGGPMTTMHHAVDRARDVAGNFANVVRRRAFSPAFQSRQHPVNESR